MEWSTDKIEAWIADAKQFERDLKLEVIFGNEDNEPFAVPIVNGYRSDITFKYTPEEIEEVIKLTKKPLTINNHQPNKLRDYQKEMLDDINQNMYSILNVSRQIGTNMVTAHHVLYYCLSYYDKTVLFLCENEDTSDKFFKCVLDLLFQLPYHLQVGIRNISFKEGIISLTNGSKLKVESDPLSIGFGVDYLILPNFSFNKENKSIIYNLLPTLFTRSNSRVLIYSCPNEKDDYFKKMFFDDENVYFKKTYPYTIMNLPNNKIFEETQIAMIGEDSFLKEYECIFPGTSEFRDKRLGSILN
jgi:hypothetical protein